MFEHIPPYAGDPILTLNESFGRDPRAHKINLSISSISTTPANCR